MPARAKDGSRAADGTVGSAPNDDSLCRWACSWDCHDVAKSTDFRKGDVERTGIRDRRIGRTTSRTSLRLRSGERKRAVVFSLVVVTILFISVLAMVWPSASTETAPTPARSDSDAVIMASNQSAESNQSSSQIPSPYCFLLALTATPTVGTAPPLAVSFKAETDGSGCESDATWTWGDGNSSQNNANGSARVKVGEGVNSYYVYYYWFNFTHTYRFPGHFVAQFTSSLGASGSLNIYVEAVGAVSLSASPMFGLAPLAVSFSFETFLATSGYTASWTFGDGNSSHQSSPNGTVTIGGIPYEWWNYTHTYRYDSTFSPEVNVSYPGRYYVTASSQVEVGWVSMTFVTFENWTTDWIPAMIQVCLTGNCSTVSDGHSLLLRANEQYTLNATDLASGIFVSQWLTNAGSISSSTSNPTAFTANRSGTLSLIVGWFNWAGYVYSPPVSGPSVTMVSGVLSTPKNLNSTSSLAQLGIWVGIGGMPGTNLWQAGVELNETKGATTMVAWWEACSSSPEGCNTIHWIPSFSMAPGDQVFVNVTSSGGVSTYTIRDLTKPGQPSTSGSVSYTPSAETGEWAIEYFAAPLSGGIAVTSMVVNGVPTSLYSSYLLEDEAEESGSYWVASLLIAGTSGSQFSLAYHS